MIRLDILNDKLDELDVRITRYANDNLKEIIRVLLDVLEDDNGLPIWDVIPRNATSISSEEWIKLLYNLYDIVCARALRDYIKPKYQYLLYLILLWLTGLKSLENNHQLTKMSNHHFYEKTS